MKTNVGSLVVLIAMLALPADRSLADSSTVLARGFQANGVYQVNELDSVNLFNGNLMVNVPIGQVYKSNGSLSYQFSLNYNANIWDLYHFHGVTFSQLRFPPQPIYSEYYKNGQFVQWVIHTQARGAEEQPAAVRTATQSVPEPGDVTGVESVPRGNAGLGWMFSLGQFDGSYISQDGSTTSFGNSMHGVSTLSSADTLYSADGKYLRLHIRQRSGVHAVKVDVDTPDGLRRRFTCISGCEGSIRPQWNLNWIADPYGNVLLIRYEDQDGFQSSVAPNSGAWVWSMSEMTRNDAEAPGTGTQYYNGEDPATLTLVRRHKAYFRRAITSNAGTNRPWEVRLEKLALAAPDDGKYALYEFVYADLLVPSELSVPWPNHGEGLNIPYVLGPRPGREPEQLAWRGASGLAGIRLPDPAGLSTVSHTSTNASSAGVWQFRYYEGQQPGDPDPVQYGSVYYPVSRSGGRLRMVKLPTGGGYRYEYGSRNYPTQSCGYAGGGAGHGVSYSGVSKRQQIDHLENDVSNAAWYYVGAGWLATPTTTRCQAPTEFISAVIAPPSSALLGTPNRLGPSAITLSFFSLKPNDTVGWAHLGWPYTEEQMLCAAAGATSCAGQAGTKYLSQRVVSGSYETFRNDPHGSVRRIFTRYLKSGEQQTEVTPLRSTYVQYEQSITVQQACADQQNDPLACGSSNLRPILTREVFHDDGDAYVETVMDTSTFDGFGHYQRVTTTSDFHQRTAGTDAPEQRVRFVDYNGTPQYQPGQAYPPNGPAPGEPWLINMYTRELVTENNVTYKREAEFDEARGHIRSTRKVADTTGVNPAADNTKDVVQRVERTGGSDSTGRYVRIREYLLGGHGVTIGSGNEGATYVKDTVLRAGAVAEESYRRCNQPSAPFLVLLSATIDQNTGLPKTIADSSKAQSVYAYDALGRVRSVTPPTGDTANPPLPQTYTYVYATQGRMGTEPPSQLGPYSPSKVEIARTSPQIVGPQTKHFYDAMGRPSRDETLLPAHATNWTEYVYSGAGKLILQVTDIPDKDNNAQTSTVYDALGRTTAVTYPDRTVRNYSYGGTRSTTTQYNGVSLAGETGSVLHDQYRDGLGRVRRVNDSKVRADYTYDAAGHLTDVLLTEVCENCRRATQRRSFTYDGRDFLTSERHPELGPGTIEHQQYDAMGLPQKRHYVSNSALDASYRYDSAGRLVEVTAITPLQSAPTLLKQFFYHPHNATAGAAGKLHYTVRRNVVPTPNASSTAMGVDVRRTFTYDSAGRVTGVELQSGYNGAFTATVGYQYDQLDQVRQITYPGLAVGVASQAPASVPVRHVLYGYERGSLTSVSATGTTSWALAALAYHSNGLLKTVSRTRGSRTLEDRIGADGDGMLRPSVFKWQYVAAPPAAAVQTHSTGPYVFDGAGNIKAIDKDEYRYDSAFRLASSRLDGIQETYQYDPFGNLTARTRPGVTVNTPASGQTNRINGFGYDSQGNVTSMPDPSSAQPLQFTWDDLGTMTSVGGEGIGRIFLYDAADERVATLDYKAAGGSLRERWSIRGMSNQVLRDYERSGGKWAWVKDYIYRGTALASTVGANESLRDIHVDHLGSTRLVTDAGGRPVAIGTAAFDSPRKYRPFGELTLDRPLAERMAFTGHERDEDPSGNPGADLDYMHARYYAPHSARFLSVDPARSSAKGGVPQSFNRYSYVLNNPLKHVDPDGREVYVVTRPLDSSSRLAQRGTHSFVVVSPTGTNMVGLADRTIPGRGMIVLGGYKASGEEPKGMLVKRQNYEVDTDTATGERPHKQIFEVKPPKGMTMEQFERAVVAAYDEYDNSAEYEALSVSTSDNQGNCHSLTTTMLVEAGVSVDTLPEDLDGADPGWRVPLRKEDEK